MSDIEAGVTYLMTQISGLSSIQDAPDKPPESPADFPFAAAWPRDGLITGITRGEYQNVGVLRLEIHVARNELEADMDLLYPLLDQVMDVVMDPDHIDWGDNIEHIIADNTNPVQWVFGPMDWGEEGGMAVITIGWRIDIPYKYKRIIP